MKKIAVVLLAAACLLLTSCGKSLSGSYVNDTSGRATTYKFRRNRVTVTVTSTLLGTTVTKGYEGEYHITVAEGGSMFIELDFDSDEAGVYEGTKTFAENPDDGTVTIGGVEYRKAD